MTSQCSDENLRRASDCGVVCATSVSNKIAHINSESPYLAQRLVFRRETSAATQQHAGFQASDSYLSNPHANPSTSPRFSSATESEAASPGQQAPPT